MFSKGGDRTKSGYGDSGGEAPRGAMSASATPSLISADLKVVGNLISAGDLQIDGDVEGDVQSRSVTVGEAARIKGQITADAVRISGTLDGEVKAASVTIAKTAKVKGDLYHRTLSIEAGATIEGQVRRMEGGKGSGAKADAPAKPTVVGPAANGAAGKPAAT